MNKIKRFITFCALTLISIFSSCSTGGSPSSTDLISNTDSISEMDWRCFKIGDDDLCTPSIWLPIRQKEYYYMSNLDDAKNKTSFVILRYTINEINITPIIYLKESYSQMLKDSVENFTGFTVKRLIFQDQDVYYSEFFSERSKVKYLTYSMMFEKDNYLYDFCLKVEKVKSVKYKDVLRDILLSFKIKGEQVFHAKDEIEKIELIDISKL